LGPVQSWDQFRAAAVEEVGTKGEWESVVGLHSFECVAGLGEDATTSSSLRHQAFFDSLSSTSRPSPS